MDDIEKELELDLENMNIDNVDTSVSNVHHIIVHTNIHSVALILGESPDLILEYLVHKCTLLGFVTLSSFLSVPFRILLLTR